jgi:hypothetical protein
MTTRELQPDEWAMFFDCFSRRLRGRPVTVLVGDSDAATHAVARRLPLVGVTAEQSEGRVRSIEVLTGAPGSPPAEHVSHVVRSPSAVRIGQVSNGEDEVLIIQSATDPTTFVDFSSREVFEVFEQDTNLLPPPTASTGGPARVTSWPEATST